MKGKGFFTYRLSSARIPIENSFGRLKVRFRCLQGAMEVKFDTLPQVIYWCFVLHNYCDNKNENLPYQRVHPSASSLSYGEKVNENRAISFRNTLTKYFE